MSQWTEYAKLVLMVAITVLLWKIFKSLEYQENLYGYDLKLIRQAIEALHR